MRIDFGNGVYVDAHIAKTHPDLPVRPRPAVVVLPGGAYLYCSPREAEPVANQFIAAACNTFTLFYSVGENARDKNPLKDVARVIDHIRTHAEEYNVDPNNIATIGFSAGGHLSAWIASAYNDPALEGLDCRPNAAMCCYPLVRSHPECFQLLLGLDKYPDEKQAEHLYTDNMVHKNTPPMFIWHTFADECVPLADSLALANALYKKGVPFEMHVFPHGHHGMSICTDETTNPADVSYNDPYLARWVDMAIKWLNKQFGR